MKKIAVILVLPIEYNTSSMLRCKAIIKGLVELGHKVKVYCPYPDVNSKYYDPNNSGIDGIEVYRFGKNTTKTNVVKLNTENTMQKKVGSKSPIKAVVKNIALGLFRKVDVFGATLLYLPERKVISKDISNGSFDIMLSFSDPMPAHMIAKYCKKHNRQLRYIQQWGDPLTSDTISKIAQPVWLKKIVEVSLLKPADKACYVSPFTCEEQKVLFPQFKDKIIFLPTPSIEYEEDNEKIEGMNIGYYGSYNSIARDIKPFYEAAKRNPEVNFYIVGDSDLKLDSTENISIIGRVAPDKLNEYMKKTNVIVCLMNLKGNQIPGKVYHDASSTKDILFIKDGEYGDQIQKFFGKYNHYTFSDNTCDSIDEAIKGYIANGVPVRKPVDDFRFVRIAEKLIE